MKRRVPALLVTLSICLLVSALIPSTLVRARSKAIHRGKYGYSSEPEICVNLTENWLFKTDPTDRGVEEEWFIPDFDDSNWKIIAAAKEWEKQGFPNYDGYAWYRKWVSLSRKDWKGKPIFLILGGVDDEYDLFVNGKKVGHHGSSSNSVWNQLTWTDISPYVKLGTKNLICLRVYDWGGGGGICRAPVRLADQLYRSPEAKCEVGEISYLPGNIALLGGKYNQTDNRLYFPVEIKDKFVISGKLYIPDKNIGKYDSVSLAVFGFTKKKYLEKCEDQQMCEYWATIGYGKGLYQKNHISIMENDRWGDLYFLPIKDGWYDVKVSVNLKTEVLKMKTWQKDTKEPDWQTSKCIPFSWEPRFVGFRHFGNGTMAKELKIDGKILNLQKGPVLADDTYDIDPNLSEVNRSASMAFRHDLERALKCGTQ